MKFLFKIENSKWTIIFTEMKNLNHETYSKTIYTLIYQILSAYFNNKDFAICLIFQIDSQKKVTTKKVKRQEAYNKNIFSSSR